MNQQHRESAVAARHFASAPRGGLSLRVIGASCNAVLESTSPKHAYCQSVRKPNHVITRRSASDRMGILQIINVYMYTLMPSSGDPIELRLRERSEIARSSLRTISSPFGPAGASKCGEGIAVARVALNLIQSILICCQHRHRYKFVAWLGYMQPKLSAGHHRPHQSKVSHRRLLQR